jgi:hypothetical protein
MGLRRVLAAVAVAAAVAAPAGATTLIRQSLDELVANNSTVVVGEVVAVRSYWNQDGTFILSDVTFGVSETLKGQKSRPEITITVMGGTVGELTTLIVGGPELVEGRSYVLFLNREDLPGAPAALTVRDLSQGAFDLRLDERAELRAVSQARNHPLLADEDGLSAAPGGALGLSFDDMTRAIREIASRPEEAY